MGFTVSTEKIAEIRERIDIEQVVGRAVQLHRKGQRSWGCCPFHPEKTPSFTVDASKKLYHCFGCQAGGDVFDFVMKVEGIDFRDAVLMLAREANVTIEQRDENPHERDQRLRRERMFQLNASAATFYQHMLQKTPRALAYLLQERGLSESTIDEFQIGWAPADWTALTNHLANKKLDVKLAAEIGLCGTRPSDGTQYDRLRGRVVFPITLPNGDIAGFGARRADWLDQGQEAAKYLNSPESPVYDKSSTLYGLSHARDHIRRSKRAIIVEGYVDVIGVHQAGIRQAIAACGTALSLRHASMLKKLAKEVVTLYDGDQAGQDATRKAAELLLSEGLAVRVVVLPETEDPDTFVRRVGQAALEKLIEEAPSAIDFFVAQAKNAYKGGGIAGMAKAVDAIRPLLIAVKDPLERDVCINASAKQLGIDPQILRKHLSAAPSRHAVEPPPPQREVERAPEIAAPVAKKEIPPVIESAILRALLETPEGVIHELDEKSALDAFTHAGIRRAVDEAIAAFRAGKPFDAAQALEVAASTGTLDDAMVGGLRKILMEPLPNPDPIDVCVKRLLRNRITITVRHLRQKLAKEVDSDAQFALAKEIDQLNRTLASLTLSN